MCISELSILTRVEKAVKRPIFVNEFSSAPDFNGCIALLYISYD